MSTITERAVLRRERHGSVKALAIVGTAVNWRNAVRIAAPLGALYVEGWPAFIGAILFQESGLWLVRRISDAANRQLATALFLAAYGLRIAIVLPSHYLAKLGNGNGALYPDNYTADLVGEWLVRIAHAEGATAIFPGHQYLLASVYSYLLMGIYVVFGYTPILPKLLNVSLAALCAVLTFGIASKIFSRRAAVLAALGAAFLPSLIVWSVATLKETLVLFVSLVALWALQIVSEGGRRERRVWDALVVLLGATLLLLDLRSTSAFIVVGLLGLFIVGRSRVRLRLWQVALAGTIIAGLLIGSTLVIRERTSNRPFSASFEDLALQVRHRRAQEAAGAASQLRGDADVAPSTSSTPSEPSALPAAEASSDAAPFSFVGDVLDPLGYALMAPTPWQAGSTLELAASAEMIVWYVLLLASFVAWRAGPRQPLFVFGLIVYGVANWLILAAVEGNVGNLLRHRMMLDPVLLILGAAGLEWLWLRLRPQVQSYSPAGTLEGDGRAS